MDDWERRQKLEAALREAVQTRKPSPAEERSAARQARRTNPALAFGSLLLGWGFIAWVWVAQPEFLFGPGPPPPPGLEVQEAQLRYAMFLERARIEAHVQARGRLPATLAEAGPVEDFVFYERTGTGYVLIGERGLIRLRLTNRMAADSFLGESLGILRR